MNNPSASLLLLLLSCGGRSTMRMTQAAIQQPGFWETNADELSKLFNESAPYLNPDYDYFSNQLVCNKLPGYTNEHVKQLTNATVVLMDNDLLCADFQETCVMSKVERERWILKQTAWFSAPHLDTNVNDIPYNDATTHKIARRPCGGNRALLIPVEHEHQRHGNTDTTINSSSSSPKWIDVKGLGTRQPQTHSVVGKVNHANGLVELQNALWEYLNEKITSAVLAHHARNYPSETYSTVGIYAVVSLGFQFPWEKETTGDYQWYSAASIVRQASRRHPNPHGFMAVPESIALEQILNSYGIRSDTSSQDYRFQASPNSHCRRINIQGTMRPREVTDFGNIYVDDSDTWPPSNDECMVHWERPGKRLARPTWNRLDIGSKNIRDFMKKHYRDLTLVKNTTWPAKPSYTIVQKRLWEVADAWWKGTGTLADIVEITSAKRVEELLKSDMTNHRAKDEEVAFVISNNRAKEVKIYCQEKVLNTVQPGGNLEVTSFDGNVFKASLGGVDMAFEEYVVKSGVQNWEINNKKVEFVVSNNLAKEVTLYYQEMALTAIKPRSNRKLKSFDGHVFRAFLVGVDQVFDEYVVESGVLQNWEINYKKVEIMVSNNLAEEITLYYQEKEMTTIQPGGNIKVRSFDGHVFRASLGGVDKAFDEYVAGSRELQNWEIKERWCEVTGQTRPRLMDLIST